MFMDTLMALWNIICRGRIRKMLVTSLGVGIGLICLLAFIVIPAFSRSSDLLSNMASSSDADQNANDVVLTQNHSRYEVTPPEVPPHRRLCCQHRAPHPPIISPSLDQLNLH
ncbi:hypothetical protein [Dictyobacter halimunensis]|uniref:hypothetical protein n=1 Tax=Dictyobacter halimunensis TaxID=3026934 RepID=UPI0030C69726